MGQDGAQGVGISAMGGPPLSPGSREIPCDPVASCYLLSGLHVGPVRASPRGLWGQGMGQYGPVPTSMGQYLPVETSTHQYTQPSMAQHSPVWLRLP